MNLAIGSDHAGFGLKQSLKEHLAAEGHSVLDVGAFDDKPSDWPDFARLVAQSVKDGKAERGVIVCGSGVGACVAANKFLGIRASQATDLYTARQSVEHDDVNVLCLGARITKEDDAKKILAEFLAARFTNEERHARRLNKLLDIEKKNFK